jgi:hypothetical protein
MHIRAHIRGGGGGGESKAYMAMRVSALVAKDDLPVST